jgi:two-component system, cell cycle response regulator
VRLVDNWIAEQVAVLERRACFQPVGDLAARWLAEHALQADSSMVQRVRLVAAQEDVHLGQLEQGARVMHEICYWAKLHKEYEVEARSERMLSSLFRRLGDPQQTLEHAVSAMKLLPGGRPVMSVDLHLGYADALAMTDSYEESIQKYTEAYDQAVAIQDHDLRLTVLNNWAFTDVMAGRAREAIATVRRLQVVRHEVDTDLQLFFVDTIAQAYCLDKQLVRAQQLLRDALAHPPPNHPLDDFAECLLTLARVERELGYPAAAAAALEQCLAICEEQPEIAAAARVLREQAAQHAAAGRFEDAYRSFGEFHEREMKMHKRNREVRARTWQVLYETEQARQESARYREMSYQDALTGLYNRRFVDEQLGRQLQRTAEAGESLTVAFVDLDHFKNVNDQCSHEIGDRVLRRVAGMLQARGTQYQGGFAARMGGEEFLLVLPGMDAESAWEVLEALRREIASTDWSPLTGSVPVTASMGSATMPVDGHERLKLLARADEQLYVAKSTGRNRVTRP